MTYLIQTDSIEYIYTKSYFNIYIKIFINQCKLFNINWYNIVNSDTVIYCIYTKDMLLENINTLQKKILFEYLQQTTSNISSFNIDIFDNIYTTYLNKHLELTIQINYLNVLIKIINIIYKYDLLLKDDPNNYVIDKEKELQYYNSVNLDDVLNLTSEQLIIIEKYTF